MTGCAGAAPPPESGHRGSRATGGRRSLLLLINGGIGDRHADSIVPTIRSATTDGGQAVASGKGHPGGVGGRQ